MSKFVSFEEVLGLNYGKSLPKSERVDGIYNVYGSSGCVGTHQKCLVKGPGIIVGRKGTIGSVTWSEKDFFPIDTTYYVTINDSKISLKFAYYLLKYLPLNAMNTDAAVPGLNRNNVYRLTVNIHNKHKREIIANILSNYDNLIENNRRRIALLEESARLLYREWFVHFRFPGYEKVKIVDGIPEGWELKQLKEVANLTMGQSPASKFYNKFGDGLPFHQGVTDYGERFITDRVYSTYTTKLAYPNDILLSVRAPVGRINITKNKIILGRGLAAINSKVGANSFLFYTLRTFFFKEDVIGTGSIYASTTKEQLEKIELPNPFMKYIEKFESIVSPIDSQISKLDQQILKLAQARDLLLPRLMDGRIKL